MTKRRRALGPYAGRTFAAMLRSLRMLSIVIIAAGSGLLIIKTVNDTRHLADQTSNRAIVITEPLFAKPIDPPAAALNEAVVKLLGEPVKELSFSSRDRMLSTLLPHVITSRHYPTVAAVVETHKPEISKIEKRIAAAKSDKELQQQIRNRDFAIDALRLEIIGVPEAQRNFVATAMDRLDSWLAARPEMEKPARGPLDSLADSSHPFHVVYEAIFYLSFVVVALAVSYCAALLLKLLPYPGAADKWSSKMEETFSTQRRAEPKGSSPVASILLTTTVLGVGLIAASDPLHDQPGSPFYHSSIAELLPDHHQELSGQRDGDSAGPTNVTVNTPPYPTMNPTFEFNPVNPPVTVNQPAINQVITPAKIEGLDELKSGIDEIAAQARATNNALVKLQEVFEKETERTQQLQQLVTDAKTEWTAIGAKIDTAGTQLRNSIAAANYNDEQRYLLSTRQEATAGARSAWRGLLMLGQYQLNATALAAFETEPCEEELHGQLRDALRKMETEGLDPLYQAPFETTILDRMIGSDALNGRGNEFKTARAEMWRHLPVLLETSRVAERGIRK